MINKTLIGVIVFGVIIIILFILWLVDSLRKKDEKR